MNNKRRQLLSEASGLLESVSNIISRAIDEEQESLDNLPDNLQDSERSEKMGNAVYELELALEYIEEVVEHIDLAIE